jgi:hypothetical protein
MAMAIAPVTASGLLDEIEHQVQQPEHRQAENQVKDWH